MRYLEGGHVLLRLYELGDPDFFEPSRGPVEAGIITDGVWIWPRELAYYVRNYDVSVPVEFLEHIRGMVANPEHPREVDFDRMLSMLNAP